MPALLSPSPFPLSSSSRFNVQSLPGAITFLAVKSPLRNQSHCLFPSFKKLPLLLNMLSQRQSDQVMVLIIEDRVRRGFALFKIQLCRL